MQGSTDPSSGGGLALRELVRRASDAPFPAPSETERLAGAAAAGDDDALDALVQGLMRLVVDEAIRCRGVGQRARDLVPDGVDALVASARDYRPAADGPFPSYARRRIRQAMGRRFGPH